LKLEIKNEYEYDNFNLSDDNLVFSIIKLIIGIVVVLNARAVSNWIDRRGNSKTNAETTQP
ncbi:MAG TPA: hypothetical protein PKU83_09315, partial [Chryseolinea sp.]|nr:hypothetical protein [Chryseolinea sp.]